MKAPKFREFISEKVQRSEIQVAILTKVDADSKNVVSKMIEKECERRNIPHSSTYRCLDTTPPPGCRESNTEHPVVLL